RETGGKDHLVVHAQTIGRVALVGIDAHDFVVAKHRMPGQRVDHDEPPVAEVRDAALQMQDAFDATYVDGYVGVAFFGENRRKLARTRLTRALGNTDEEVIASLADVSAVDRARRDDRMHRRIELRQRRGNA